MKKLLSKIELKNIAGSTIFERGVKYFQNGAVGNITMVSKKYTANVFGTEKYIATYNPENKNFNCNCPYDAFCKHEVAFGLKLIEQYSNLQKTSESFDTFFDAIDNSLKLQFLEKIISENSNLRTEFRKFHKFETNQFEDIEIEDIAEVLYDKIDFYDAEDIYDRASNDHYSEPYEDAIEIFEEELVEFEEEFKQYIKKESYNNILKYYLGVLLGLIKSETTTMAEFAGEPMEFIYDIEKVFLRSIKSLDDENKKQILNLFFEEIDDIEELKKWYFYTDFFNIYLENKELALLLKNKLKKYVYKKDILNLLAKIEKKLGNTESVKKLAEENPDNYKLSVDALYILKKEKIYDKINEILLRLFRTENDITELKYFITPELGEEKYKLFLEKYLLKCKDFSSYKKLRKFINNETAKSIRDKIGRDSFKHQINLHEKWYDDILQFIKKNLKNHYFNYDNYLKDIEQIYPTEAWNIHRKYVEKISCERNRKTYAEIARILKRMLKLKSIETQMIIKELYNHVPRLPALKDEFRKAKIV